MTLDDFVRRLGASLALSGLFVVLSAVVCWTTVGGGSDVAHTVHNMAGWVLAVFGAVLIAVGLALSAAVPPPESP